MDSGNETEKQQRKIERVLYPHCFVFSCDLYNLGSVKLTILCDFLISAVCYGVNCFCKIYSFFKKKIIFKTRMGWWKGGVNMKSNAFGEGSVSPLLWSLWVGA